MFDQFSFRTTNVFTESECQDIILKLNKDLDRVEQGNDGSNRKVNIKNINLDNYQEIINCVFSANETFFKFDLSYHIESYFAKYTQYDHYNREHMDCTVLESQQSLQRKLSFSLILNNDYEGGDFCIDKNDIKLNVGDIIIFPSFIPHSVKEVTKGNRYVFFGFCLGPIWR